MPEEKDYILYFYNGAVRQVRGILSELQRFPVKRIEEVVPGGDPLAIARRDMERINKALGQGFKMMQDVISPRQILKGLSDRMNGFWPK